MTTRKQMENEDEAELLARREGMVIELARLRAEHMAALLPLAKAEERAKAKLERAHDALQAAHDAYMGAMGAHAGCSNLYSRKLGKLERELTSTAPAIIDAFIAACRALADRVGSTPVQTYRDDMRASIEEREVILRDAQGAIAQRTDRVSRCLATIPLAEAMKIEALSSTELAVRLDALRLTTQEDAAIPVIA